MHRAYHRWDSPALHRSMELLIFGHGGAPCLVFPTSMGRFFQYEDQGMVAALSHQLEQGSLQLICIDSVDGESWYDYDSDTDARMWRHDQYEHYIVTEVLPLVRSINPTPYLITTGCSFGAFHAINFALRRPGLVNRAIGLSGIYDLRRFFSTYTTSLYYHNPVDYVSGINDGDTLAKLQQTDLIIVAGRDDPNIGSNQLISQKLWEKGIGNALRVWDGWCHDWPYWYQMINMYVGGQK